MSQDLLHSIHPKKEPVRFIGKIVLANALIPSFVFAFFQVYDVLLNPNGSLVLWERLATAYGFIEVFFYLLAELIGISVIIYLLYPLYKYSKTSDTDERDALYTKARRSCLRTNYFILTYHIVIWLFFTLLFGAMYRFELPPDSNPFIIILLLHIGIALWEALTVVFTMNNLLLKPKLLLQITEIYTHKNEKELSLKRQILLMITTVSMLGIGLSAAVGHYFYRVSTRIELSVLDFIWVIGGSALLYIGLVAVLFALFIREFNKASSLLEQKVESLISEAPDYTERIILTSFNELGYISDRLNRFIDKTFRVILEREQILRERFTQMERELVIAKNIQQTFISLHDDTSVYEPFKIAYLYQPLDAVGGDFFSVLPYNKGKVGIFIGDISGHGVSAALFSSLIKSTTDRFSKVYGLQPKLFLNRMNAELVSSMPSILLTALYGVFRYNSETQTTEFKYSRGGHPQPFWFQKGNSHIESLQAHGTVLGMLEEIHNSEQQIFMHVGDRLYFYTDGVYEIRNSENEMLGEEQLQTLVFKAASLPLEESLHFISEQIHTFRKDMPTDDDILLIGIET